MAREDWLSDLPDAILLHILSMLGDDSKQVVRTSVLSTRWRFLWMSVPVSLHIKFPLCSGKKGILDFLACTNRELYYWRSCHKIKTFSMIGLRYDKNYVKDFDLWVHFATKVAHVEDLTLEVEHNRYPESYEFPQFAYKCNWLKNLALIDCQLNPFGSVNWSCLLSLSISEAKLTDVPIEKVLSGCPNLERLKLDAVWGIHRLDISSAKLKDLIIIEVRQSKGLEILAPYIQNLQLSGSCSGIHFPRNMPSLVNAAFYLSYDFHYEDDKSEEECSYLKELLYCVAHVKNLELGPWCTECLSVWELEGWQSPPSRQKFLKLNTALQQLDFPGICSFLQSSPDLETLVIDWYDQYERIDLLSRYITEDEHTRRFEPHNFNCSLLHLKTIKIINFHRQVSENNSVLPVVKYLLKNAPALEEFVIAVRLPRGFDLSQDYIKMEQVLLSFPRSSPHASIIFSY